MGKLNKWKAYLSDLRNAKWQLLLAQRSHNFFENDLHAVHWEGLSEDKESNIKITDIDDEVDNTIDKYIENDELSWKSEAENNKFIY